MTAGWGRDVGIGVEVGLFDVCLTSVGAGRLGSAAEGVDMHPPILAKEGGGVGRK